MNKILKSHCVTTSEIIQHWKETKYLTPQKKEWTTDLFVNKFTGILHDIEEASVSQDKKKSADGEHVLEKLYRSDNDYGHFIFFDASEMMKYRQELYNAIPSISKYFKILENCPPNIQDFETDTYGSLKCIFDLWEKAGSIEHLTSDDLKKIEAKLEILLPTRWYISRTPKTQNNTDFELYKKQVEQHNKNKCMIEKHMFKFYIKITEKRFSNAPFIKTHYIKNGQIDLVKDWKEKWTYTIDNIASIYDNPNGTHLSISDLVNVLLIWYENEKRRKFILSDQLLKELQDKINHEEKVKRRNGKLITALNKIINEYKKNYGGDYEKINTSNRPAVEQTYKEWIEDLANFAKEKLATKYEHDYEFVIRMAFSQLEEIYNEVSKNAENPKDITNQCTEDMLPYIKKCINVIHPTDNDTIDIVKCGNILNKTK